MTGELKRARLGVSVVFAVCGAAFATWLARVPAVQERLGLSTGALATGLFGLAAGSVLALLGAGALLTRIGSRAAVVLGAVVLCAGLPLVAFAWSAPVFFAALFVLGVGNSLLDVAMNAHAARVEEGYGRPIFAGFHAFWNIGGLAGSGVDALMEATHVPVTVHFPAAGAVLLALALWAARTRFLAGADRGQGGAAFAWPSRALVPLGVIAFCGFVAEGAVNSWSAVYLADVTGATPALASLGYFAFSGTMIAVRLVADRVVARTGAVPFVRVAAVVAVLGFAVVLVAPWPVAGVLGFAVVGLGVAGIVPIAWSVASRKQPDAPGRAVAAVAACGYLGFLVEPVLVGALATRVGLHWALSSAAVVTFGILFLAPSLRVREPAPAR
ncbi:MFS transporter [Amycolatopsis sp. A133]|uniref:MFS transporter n=1 Tax=Amycolatopsis sp. A133 TaxID=3064472 RepID=UPI0027E76D0D|nr:MFS transporter [Amycolatopsis sp. A133]MDQ7802553.1 MFS transporter [Amycolatopsis sp. A133]